ncbi:hypothetical protein IE077_003157 [Cardiosporidium cionae]|uniref:Protein FAM33A n=1 Tax=Cardiosporidium cionae TaxID=476202 RepID=A0ABQ7J924_9APIC|nr:hypothetical protein IE077_003157 [Cardiosporidium cionae]|eukprot:KAF8820470.1 hypothetical protein IE077_003157 [Cardiosporidium cionae]
MAFISISEDLAIVETKLNDEFSSIFGDDQNPTLYRQRLATLIEKYSGLKEEFLNLYPHKKAVAEALQKQLHTCTSLYTLQCQSGAIIPNYYETIKEAASHVLQEWKEAEQHRQLFMTSHLSSELSKKEFAPTLARNEAMMPSVSPPTLLSWNNENFSSNLHPPPRLDQPSPEAAKPLSLHLDTGFAPIRQEEFSMVPPLIRRRSKLEDLNNLYHTIWCIIQKRSNLYSIPRKELAETGVKVFGQTGEAKLATLKYLHIIQIAPREGSITLCKEYCPPRTKKPRTQKIYRKH